MLEVAWTETEEMGPERQEDYDETCDDKMTVKVRRDEYSTHSLANVTRLGTMSCATVTCAKARENLHKGIPIACKRNSLTKKRQRIRLMVLSLSRGLSCRMTNQRYCTYSCHSRHPCHSCSPCHSCRSCDSCHACGCHQVVEDDEDACDP